MVYSLMFNLLKQMIRNNSFDAHISSGFSEIENHKIKEARYHYQRAKKIDPKRKELKVLLSQVLAEEKSYRIQQVIRHAEQEIHRDNWQQAKADFAKVIKDMPENEIEALAKQSMVLPDYKGNPRVATLEEMIGLVKEAYDQS